MCAWGKVEGRDDRRSNKKPLAQERWGCEGSSETPRTPRSAASPARPPAQRAQKPPAQLTEHNHNRRYNLNLPLTFYGGLNVKISVSQIREGLSVKDRGTGAKGEKETGSDANQGNTLLPPG